MLAGLQKSAAAGSDQASGVLLSRPILSAEALPYWEAFERLSRDRPLESVSLGMSGGLSLPRSIPLEAIRREGLRLGYGGDGLEDFVTIIARMDDSHVEHAMRRELENVRLAALRAKKR